MNTTQQEKCRKAYYHTDIEPTLDRLQQVTDIVSNFEAEGADRLQSALSMKFMDVADIERFTEYIAQACDKMEKELLRLKKYEKDFNQEFATDHNNYYNSVSVLLGKMRSHMSPLKNILKKFCPTRHPTAAQCAALDLPAKSVYESSMLSKGAYERNLFDLSTYPDAVQGLFTVLLNFFKAEEECMNLCMGILEEENDIREDPVRSWASLEKYRRKAYGRLGNQLMLFTEDILQNLKSITPAYRCREDFATEELFAQHEFHKHNRADMDHYFLIEAMTETEDITNEEKVLWGNNPKTVKRIRYVVAHFDDLLPAGFKQKSMGLYEYIFSQWAYPDNVKKAVEYFIAHYDGQYHTVKYGAANKQSVNYDRNSDIVKNFNSCINVLFADSKDADLMEFSA